MSRMFNWLWKNKIIIVLVVIVIYLFFQDRAPITPSTNFGSAYSPIASREMALTEAPNEARLAASPISADITDRIVIKNTTLSLVVNNVSLVIESIENKAKEFGGFLVNSDLNVSEGVTNGTISVRVPEEKRSDALVIFKKLSVKTVSENISGQDVTDEYVDLEARLAVLQKTKVKFENIMDSATKIPDLLEVQRELINVQTQVDSVNGTKKYLEQSAKQTLITVYLSTDELALPYVPDERWSLQTAFKQAVRSFISVLRFFCDIAIWVVVFIPLWLPALLIIRWVRRHRSFSKK